MPRTLAFLAFFLAASPAHAGTLGSLAGEMNKATGTNLGTAAVDKVSSTASSEANRAVAARFNKQLLDESRKNQCSFKSGTDQLEPGCGDKAQRLANVIIEVKKAAQAQGYSGFKFVVSGHTDSSGVAAKNKELSLRRAKVMVRELVAKGVAAADIEAVGMGSDQMLVKPDDTAEKKAKNRRYEVQIRF